MSAPTIRERLERIRDRHYKVQWIEPNNLGADDSCSHGGDGEWNLHPWPCADFEDAVAALASITRIEDLAHAHLSGNGDPRDLAYVVLGETGDPSPPPRSDAPTPKEDA